MSQFDVAFVLLIAGILVGWRVNVFAMVPLAAAAMLGIFLHGRQAGDGALTLALHVVEGLVIFEAAYVLGAMLSEARRRVAKDIARTVDHPPVEHQPHGR